MVEMIQIRQSIKLNQLTETYDLIDIYRNKYPHIKEYTWHSNSSPPIFCRLYYFFVSTSLENNVTDCKLLPGYKSDHSAVTLIINLIKLNRGPGYFKINNSFLLDSSYQSKIKNAIKEIVEFNSESNPNIKWKLIKGRIRDESIKFATYKKKESLKEETEKKCWNKKYRTKNNTRTFKPGINIKSSSSKN